MAEMVKDYFLFSTSYGISGVTLETKIQTLVYFFTDGYVLVSLILTICLFVSKRLINKAGPRENADRFNENIEADLASARVCACAVVIQTVINSLPGRQYVQYKLVIYPCSFFLICIFLKAILNLSKEVYVRKVIAVVTGGGILLSLCIAIRNPIRNQKNVRDIGRTMELAEIKKYVEYGELIAVASPDDCGLYLNTGTESATQYPYIQADLYANSKFWPIYNEQLLNSDPNVIIWNNNWDANQYLSLDVLSRYTSVKLGKFIIFEK